MYIFPSGEGLSEGIEGVALLAGDAFAEWGGGVVGG